jgi:hypothetical protein
VQPTVPTPPAPAGSDPVGDLKQAARVWRRYPLLPVATVVVSSFLCLGSASHGLAALVALVALLLVGWPGTERLFYLRAWQGEGLRLRELPAVTLRFFGRFFLLGLLTLLAYLVLALPALIAMVGRVVEAVEPAVAAGVTDSSQLDVDVPLWVTLWLVAASCCSTWWAPSSRRLSPTRRGGSAAPS